MTNTLLSILLLTAILQPATARQNVMASPINLLVADGVPRLYGDGTVTGDIPCSPGLGVANVACYSGASFGDKLTACMNDSSANICDARWLSGAQSVLSPVSVIKPVQLGVVTITCSVLPCFTLDAVGASLSGQKGNMPLRADSPTNITVSSSPAGNGPLVRVTCIYGGVVLEDVRFDGNNKNSNVTAGVEYVAHLGDKVTMHDVDFNELLTGIKIDDDNQSHRFDRIHVANTNLALDFSSNYLRDIVVSNSRLACDVQCFLAGSNDSVNTNASRNIVIQNTDMTLNNTSLGYNIGTVRNVYGFHIEGGWLEYTYSVPTSSTVAMIVLGTNLATVQGASITNANFSGNNNVSYGIELYAVTSPWVTGNFVMTLNSQFVKVTDEDTQGFVIGNKADVRGSPVTSTAGLVGVSGDSLLANADLTLNGLNAPVVHSSNTLDYQANGSGGVRLNYGMTGLSSLLSTYSGTTLRFEVSDAGDVIIQNHITGASGGTLDLDAPAGNLLRINRSSGNGFCSFRGGTTTPVFCVDNDGNTKSAAKGTFSAGLGPSSSLTLLWTTGSGAPSGSCTNGSLYTSTKGTTVNLLWACGNSSWQLVK